MNWTENRWLLLAARASRGDPAALSRLRWELPPCLTRVVRRTLEGKDRSSPAARRVLSAARELGYRVGNQEAPTQEMIERLAEAVLQSFLQRVCPPEACSRGTEATWTEGDCLPTRVAFGNCRVSE